MLCGTPFVLLEPAPEHGRRVPARQPLRKGAPQGQASLASSTHGAWGQEAASIVRGRGGTAPRLTSKPLPASCATLARAWPAAAHIRRTGQRRQRVRQGREFSVRPRRCRLLRSSLLRETAARQVHVCFVGLLLAHHMALAANHWPATAPRGIGARLPEFVWWAARADGVLAGFMNSAQFRLASLVRRRRQEDGRDVAQVKQTARHRFSRHTPNH